MAAGEAKLGPSRSSPITIIQKPWNYGNVLRGDGVGYGDYVEHFTYLRFLKMADELPENP